jgi:hypothetical protein
VRVDVVPVHVQRVRICSESLGVLLVQLVMDDMPTESTFKSPLALALRNRVGHFTVLEKYAQKFGASTFSNAAFLPSDDNSLKSSRAESDQSGSYPAAVK